MSRQTRHSTRRFRRILVLAALWPAAAFTQAPPSLTPEGTEQLYLQLIEEREEAGGLTSADLVEPLTALGMHYYDEQDYERAANVFTQARQITRVNQGFNSVAEAVLIGQVVRAEAARGNLEEAWNLEQQMLEMAKQHVGVLETAPLFREVATKRLDILRRYRGGEVPPEIALGCYYRPKSAPVAAVSPDALGTSQCKAGNWDTVQAGLLMEALEYQMLALEPLLQNGLYASAEFNDGVTNVFRASYGIWGLRRWYGDPIVRMALNRLLRYAPTSLAETVRRAEILVQLADMNLVRKRHDSRFIDVEDVMAQYEAAYKQFVLAGLGQAAIDAMFAPTLPIMLPDLEGNPLLTTEGPSGAYIDIAFDITNKGKGKDLEVVGATVNVTRAERRALMRLVGDSVYRPRTVDGRFAESSHVTVRYYLTTQD